MADISQVTLPNGTTYNIKDTKVTQTITTASNTDARPVIVGSSYSTATNPSFSTLTDTTYAATDVYIKPADGGMYANTYNLSDGAATIQYNSANQCIDFVFA